MLHCNKLSPDWFLYGFSSIGSYSICVDLFFYDINLRFCYMDQTIDPKKKYYILLHITS